jgi:hypothetical protein
MFDSPYFRQSISLVAFITIGVSGALASPTVNDISRKRDGDEFGVLINQEVINDKFPLEVFGLKVGEKYKLVTTENGDFGNLPVKKVSGINRFLGQGFHIYFQPIKEYDSFPYIEHEKGPKDEGFRTSFHSYFLPVIPKEIKSLPEFEAKMSTFEWRLMSVDWRKTKGSKEDAYFWALDLCKTFKSYLGDEGVNIDYYEDKWRSCEFRSGANVLKISNKGSTNHFSLSVEKDQLEKLNQEVDDFIRRLKAKKLLE